MDFWQQRQQLILVISYEYFNSSQGSNVRLACEQEPHNTLSHAWLMSIYMEICLWKPHHHPFGLRWWKVEVSKHTIP